MGENGELTTLAMQRPRAFLRVTCYHHEGVVLPLVQTPLLIRRGKSERSPDLRPSSANRTSASRSFYCVERNRYLNLSKEKSLMLSLRHKSKELAQYGNACNQPVRGLNMHVVMKGKGVCCRFLVPSSAQQPK
ncbi:hypothetical protein HCBG_01339 [Histoplasma capsulatum G186AR]|uniref:Uncharacterized protein n=1 Tax=Ajellomyces capsulatus (strain G186AR / H82 / ATCC MYA-2454 / RMSCC 2432) TaxID=447093 RepID=C0NEM3_AJECG|nr:uncharacterized protein HCBG_01339 [Histoplasma capsulatum G186AR]EEH09694.1 hypothetical protein HCBG_01339 [Histoplasma capsulatum G186AR]